MEEIKTAGWLAVDFFSHNYRISGNIDVRKKSLFDQLNDSTTGFMMLQDAYISPIDRPGDIVATYEASYLAKSNLTLALVAQSDDALGRKQTYGSYYGTYLSRVFLTVPSIEVAGYLRQSTRVDLRRLLSLDTEDFIAILDARVCASIRPDVVFTGGAVLVNKSHIGAFCLTEET